MVPKQKKIKRTTSSTITVRYPPSRAIVNSGSWPGGLSRGVVVDRIDHFRASPTESFLLSLLVRMAFIVPTIVDSSTLDHPKVRSSSFLSSSTSLRFTTFNPVSKQCILTIPTQPRPRSTTQNVTMQVVDVKKFEVFMPALSSTMTEGRVVQWLKQPGDRVEVGEPLMVVESDKADMDVESFEAGYLASILVDEGQSCEVGLTVAFIVENKDDIDRVKGATLSSIPDTPTTSQSSSSPVQAALPVDTGLAAPPATKPDMAELFMPALSSTMAEGKIVQWLKSEGDAVASSDVIMVVESDKADMDVESFDDGFLAHISVEEGGVCAVGEPVGYLALTKDDMATVKAWATAQSAGATPNIGAPLADLHATPIATPPSSPASSTPPTPTTSATVVNEGRIIASPRAKVVAKELGVDLRFVPGTGPNSRIQEADVVKAKENGIGVGRAEPDTALASVSKTESVVPAGKVIATPEAKKIAKKEKIDLNTLTGTGIFGRITADDVLKAAGKAPEPKPAITRPEVPAVVTPLKEGNDKPTAIPSGAKAMNAMQKAVVQNMNASLNVPVFRITYKIKTTALDDLYAKVKSKGVTMSALLAKAAAITLTKHPIMNAQYGDHSIVYRPDIHIAMAVALNDGGLITPTLKDADKTDLYTMSRQWKDLVKRSLEKKLTPDEYSSGTFVISNLGMFGVEQFDAILPPGVPGILAIGASKPVVRLQSNGLIGVEKEMNVTLTADHRHIYGADGAKFLKDLAELIETDVTALLM